MSHGRRTTDRRRRVLYSANQAAGQLATAASRREAERLRAARRPPSAYGSRVHRRLRGRWFSLVPVRFRTLLAVAVLLASGSLLLAAAHYASVAWPWIAYRPEIARPLRLDRADSFGRWLMVALLAGCAGVSLLTYQLRRYRNDDFKGHYRLWRLVLIVMLLASLNASVSILDWGGAMMDAALGKRVALTGSDWLRLLVSLAGAVLALRLVAEVRRCRFSLAMMLLTCALLSLPVASKWNVLRVESLERWAFVTAAPLLACTTLFISLGSYLRMLYREVRRIEDGDSLWQRCQHWQQRLWRRSEPDEDQEADEQTDSREPRRKGWGRQRPAVDAAPEADDEPDEDGDEEYEDTPDASGGPAEAELDRDASPAGSDRPARRSWFSFRHGKSTVATSDGDEQPGEETAVDPSAAAPPSKRRRFSLRLSSARKSAASAAETVGAAQRQEPVSAEQRDEDRDSEVEAAAPPRGRLASWFGRGKQTNAAAVVNPGTGNPPSRSIAAAGREDDDDADDFDSEEMESGDVDRNSLSKAERRRLRKQHKRQNRAA